jgi:hypothetical protein
MKGSVAASVTETMTEALSWRWHDATAAQDPDFVTVCSMWTAQRWADVRSDMAES